MVGETDPALRRETVLPAGHGLALLEHELPLPRPDRGGGDRQGAGAGAPRSVLRAAPPRRNVVPDLREGADGDGPWLPFRRNLPLRAPDRPGGRNGGHA